MNRLNSRLDIGGKIILELGGKYRKLSRWSPEIETMKEILGDMEDKVKVEHISNEFQKRN